MDDTGVKPFLDNQKRASMLISLRKFMLGEKGNGR